MALTPAQLKASFWNVLYSDSAGSAVRAALGAGAASIIEREKLRASALPIPPFLVLWWNSRPSGGPRNRASKTFYPVWAIYDSALYGYSRIESLEPRIEAAYPEDAIAMCYLDFEPIRDLTDDALNLPARSKLFKLVTRG